MLRHGSAIEFDDLSAFRIKTEDREELIQRSGSEIFLSNRTYGHMQSSFMSSKRRRLQHILNNPLKPFPLRGPGLGSAYASRTTVCPSLSIPHRAISGCRYDRPTSIKPKRAELSEWRKRVETGIMYYHPIQGVMCRNVLGFSCGPGCVLDSENGRCYYWSRNHPTHIDNSPESPGCPRRLWPTICPDRTNPCRICGQSCDGNSPALSTEVRCSAA